MKNMKKLILIIAGVAVVVGGAAFFGGMKYGKSGCFNFAGRNFGGQGQFGVPFRQSQEAQAGGSAKVAGFKSGANMVAGEIISKDDTSITVKLPDGGSKIIFLSDSASVTKSVDGSVSDLKEGEQVTVTGEQNSDGSYTAKTVQIRTVVK